MNLHLISENEDDLLDAPPAEETASIESKPESEVDRKALIADNIKLAYWFANRWANVHQNTGVTAEDVLAQAKLGLAKAANTWDPKKGLFSNYAPAVIRNHMNHLYYKETDYEGHEFKTLDKPFEDGDSGDDEGGDATPKDNLTYGDDYKSTGAHAASRADAVELLRDAMEQLDPKQQKALELHMAGKNLREIGAEMGLSHSMAGWHISNGMKALKEIFAEKGIAGINDLLMPESIQEPDVATLLESILIKIEAHILCESLLQ